METTKVWLGWDDGRLFYVGHQEEGCEPAEVPRELLEALDATYKALWKLENAVWALREL